MPDEPSDYEKGKHLPMFERARELRRDATTAEQRLWSLLRGRRCAGLRFLRQVPAGHYVLDFFCPVARLAVEIDGGIHNRPDVQTYDREREAVLREEMHIMVFRVSNKTVMESSESVLHEKIEMAAQNAMANAPGLKQRPARIQRANH